VLLDELAPFLVELLLASVVLLGHGGGLPGEADTMYQLRA
jgi:hypothetical protein